MQLMALLGWLGGRAAAADHPGTPDWRGRGTTQLKGPQAVVIE